MHHAHRVVRPTGPLARLALLACLGLLGLAACRRSPPDPKARARQTIAQLEAAVEAQDLGAIKALIAPGYHDNHSNDRAGALRYLQLRFLKRQAIHAFVREADLHLRSDGVAEADLLVAVASTALPDVAAIERLNAAVYRMTLTLTPDGDALQVSAATWHRAGLGDLLD